ncbi:ubiquitin carboxyl-terminal hydrolase 19-like, partial [Notothenia coriiceps]|uniref:Ubiquitin carboxyl-terminal hydrolase 19-like n=1 Tax=Notothenia coriiceps TaxID=8208 RepID=A0A6I9MW07_9TELE
MNNDVFVDWKQNVNEVTVRLRCGEGVQRIEDINTTFTDTHCHVHFPDGRQWSCQLQEEIEASCSRVQHKEKGGFLHVIMHKKIPFHIWPSLKSNKKEKETFPIETKKEKELEGKPVASESSEKSRVSSTQPNQQPPPTPAHSESRRGGSKAERGVKRGLKNKQACDKTTTDSAGVKGGAGDGSAPTSKPVAVTQGEPQEPSAKRTVTQLPAATKEATSPADRDAHTHLPAGRSPQTQRRDGDNKGGGEEQRAGVAAGSHTNKTQVRNAVVFFYLESQS